jgi:RES domain-containing protein
MPRTFVAIEFALEVVLDLTEGRNRQALAISESRLLACDWRADMRRGKTPLTQRVGAAAASTGFEAILVRSAADPAGRNLVIFIDNLRSSSRLGVLAPGEL